MGPLNLYLFTFFFLYSSVAASQFHKFLGAYSAAYDKYFHDGLLKQLNAFRQSSASTTVTSSPTDISFENLGFDTIELLAAVNSTNETYADGSTSTFQIYTTDILPTNPSPSAQCSAALIATISCNSTVPLMSTYPFLVLNDLISVCNDNCTESLANYRDNVVSSCGSYVIPGPNNISYAPTLAVDTIAGAYVVQCLRDPTTQQFCQPILASFNASGGLLDLPEDELCTFCTLETLNVTLSNPITYSEPIAEVLSSAITSCGPQFNSYNVSAPPEQGSSPISNVPSFGLNVTSPGADCSFIGVNITVSENTTCSAVAAQNNVTIDSILMTNTFLFGSNDCSIPSGSQLCLLEPCVTYNIQVNDTCTSVAAMAGSITGMNITSVQLQSFNPGLGTYCQLMPLKVGEAICISPNGGWPDVGAPANANIPSAAPTTFAPIPTPTVNGTTSDCGRYYLVQVGDVCNSVVLNNSISLSDFLTLNPEVNENCTNLWLGYNYCVAPFPPFSSSSAVAPVTTNFTIGTITSISFPTSYTPTLTTVFLTPAGVPAPTNVANGTRTAACGWYYTVMQGDTIESISNTTEISEDDLFTWNPELESSDPIPGTAICILFPLGNYTLFPASTPSNVAANVSTDICAEYYTVQPGDSCPIIETNQFISSSDFLSLNPGLNAQCTNLIAGAAYCILSIFSPGNSTSSTAPPTNVASGTITEGCTEYYTVVEGDSCPAIESKFNISDTLFHMMNPEINSACSNILIGEAYCVQTSNSTGPPSNVAAGTITEGCTEYYTIVTGDSCPTVESKFNISDTLFHLMNPEINSGCTNILLGEAYCVQTANSTGPPSNVASGTISDGCIEYYTVVSGDSCPAIETKFNISDSLFRMMNPEINSACTNIIVGEAYCVKTSNSTGPPSNVATGTITAGCTEYYTVVTGDSCPAIETKFNVTDTLFRLMNPEINSACSNILVGEAYCVATSNSTTTSNTPPSNVAPGTITTGCTGYYTVVSGDSCPAIETKFNVTDFLFRMMNPEINSACSNIIVGEAYCVKTSNTTTSNVPNNVASGTITTGCNQYYTVVSGDSCGGIETKFSITDAQFHTWNPEVNSGCTNILLGEAYCVSA
ncbi:hypothetical protein Clacol_001266 [Clathrus columnatus]|uniref:LysM domain-containing protein n=1 Tax=Clathrus columnatus TaxID=1419009 RepID=A0AAV4ZXZ2_9AGAM|nr:hypothetical protein Clacol_001266 [Clathrus columnatus]